MDAPGQLPGRCGGLGDARGAEETERGKRHEVAPRRVAAATADPAPARFVLQIEWEAVAACGLMVSFEAQASVGAGGRGFAGTRP